MDAAFEMTSPEGGASVDSGLEWAKQLEDLVQGDVVALNEIPLVTGPKQAQWLSAPHGVVVISQTCDLVRDVPTTVEVAVIRHETDEAIAREAKQGRRPSLVSLPALGESFFADLTQTATIAKLLVASKRSHSGIGSVSDARIFGQRVGRKFSRFPFPDVVVEWIRPLQKIVKSKAPKVHTSEGWALEKVASLRLECEGGWSQPPYRLTLCCVMEPGVLPVYPPDELPPLEPAMGIWINGPQPKTAHDIAERLQRNSEALSTADRYWLWSALADTWAQRCKPPQSATQETMAAVEDGEIRSDIISTEEFSFERFRRSEEIDLDYISAPLPL
ncbi:hypothetical protein AB0K86_19775 [Streptomyces clavifer]|uniref:hypothetical protein n=1 Tax=Streptomyces clavifer TaxID=68188 RepID=UPI0034223DE3